MAPFLVAAGGDVRRHVLDAGDPARARPRVRRLAVAGRAEHLGGDRRARLGALVLGPALGPDRPARVARAGERGDRRPDRCSSRWRRASGRCWRCARCRGSACRADHRRRPVRDRGVLARAGRAGDGLLHLVARGGRARRPRRRGAATAATSWRVALAGVARAAARLHAADARAAARGAGGRPAARAAHPRRHAPGARATGGCWRRWPPGALFFTFVGTFSYIDFRLEAPPFSLGPAVAGLVFLVWAMGSPARSPGGGGAPRLAHGRARRPRAGRGGLAALAARRAAARDRRRWR